MGRDLAVRCWVVALVVLGTTRLQAASLHEQVEQLLKFSAEPSYASLQSARKFYDALPEKNKQDWRLEYAYTIVLTEGRQYAEAGKRLHDLARTKPDDLAVRCARIWVELTQDNRAAALADLAALAKKLGAVDAKKLDEGHKRTSAFLGRVFAFLEGPAASVKNAKLNVAKVKAQVRQTLRHEELVSDFERGAMEVTEQFQMLRDEVLAATQEVVKQQAEDIAKQQRELDEKKKTLDDQRKDLQDKAQERNEETVKKVDKLSDKADDLENAYLALMARAAPLQWRRDTAREEIRLRTVVVTQEGTNQQQTTINDPLRVGQLARLVAELDAQLALIAAEANAVRLRLMAVTNQGRGTVTEHLNNLQKMAAENQKLGKKDKQLERRAKQQAKAKASGNNLETRAMISQLSSFGTYEPFFTEEERERILKLCKD